MEMNSFENRHPSIQNLMNWLDPNPNLPSEAIDIAQDVMRLAVNVVDYVQKDSPELTAGLRKLLEAKDCFVRAALDEQPGFWTDR
jgi:hypothetical protein